MTERCARGCYTEDSQVAESHFHFRSCTQSAATLTREEGARAEARQAAQPMAAGAAIAHARAEAHQGACQSKRPGTSVGFAEGSWAETQCCDGGARRYQG